MVFRQFCYFCRREYVSFLWYGPLSILRYEWTVLEKSLGSGFRERSLDRSDLGAHMIPSILTWTVFCSGITMATFGASGVFFLKLWKTSKDRFFLGFAIACWLLSVERIVGLFITSTLNNAGSDVSELSSGIYLIRLLAFITILLVVIDKNRSQNNSWAHQFLWRKHHIFTTEIP